MKIGILGGGQLGRMLALAGYPLGLRFRAFDPSPDCPASQVCETAAGEYTDENALRAFARGLDVITYEFENLPLSAFETVSAFAPVVPRTDLLEVSQERLLEKRMFDELSIPVGKYAKADHARELETAVGAVGLPCVVKTRRFGYDGKGQKFLREAPACWNDLWEELGKVPLIVEQFIDFDREVSQILVRDAKGGVAFYPLTENLHQDGILRRSLAPCCEETDSIARQAREYVTKIAERHSYVGVLAVEFFVCGERLFANETAPRVHNSGHWTQNAGIASQFENHVRAVAGLPLGPTEPQGAFAMVNLIGTVPDLKNTGSRSGVFYHLYGKAERPGRKLGHVNFASPTREQLERLLSSHSPHQSG